MMKKAEVQAMIEQWKYKKNVRLYTPFKYFKGFTTKKLVEDKLEEMLRFRNQKDVSKLRFSTDQEIPRSSMRRSIYHQLFESRYLIPSSSSLRDKAKVSGVSERILKTIFDKGVAAWKTGHRPGASAYQWGNARVDSFLVLGCTALSADASLLHELWTRHRRTSKLQLFFQQSPSCPAYKIRRYRTRSDFPFFLFE